MAENEQDKAQRDFARGLLGTDYEKNVAFNDYLDSNGEAFTLIDAAGEKTDITYLASEVIYYLDPDGYLDHKNEWENEAVREEHKSAVELLEKSKKVVLFKEIGDAVKKRRIVPFIGAGLSSAMKMPLWGSALRDIREEIGGESIPEFDDAVARGDYLGAAQALDAKDSVLTSNFIRKTYRVDEAVGAIRLLPRIGRNCIVTTNFDNAIETMFDAANQRFEGTMYGIQDGNFLQSLVKGERCLLKLHGDARQYNTYVFTKKQYVDNYGEPTDFQKPLPKALRQIFVGSSLLFIGCALDDDWTLKLFREVIATREYEVPDHYAFLEAPASTEERSKKESALVACHIQPIWFPHDRFEYVDKLLSLLVDVVDGRYRFK